MFDWDFDAAIFDIDGTLLDSMEVWHEVDRKFLGKRGFESDAEYEREMAALYFDLAAQYTIDRFSLNETVEDIKREWNELARDAYVNDVQAVPGAAEYLAELHSRGIKLAFATSNNAYLSEPALTAHGIRDFFCAHAYTSETGKDKSEPDVFLLAAERLGVSPERCVVFEDVLRCIKGAKKAGFRTVAVCRGVDGKAELEEFADAVISDFTCIPL